MDFFAKGFYDLTTTELYEIIKSRTEVFLLEQQIICQDLDDIDYQSIHCFFRENNRVTAYLRAFRSPDEPKTVVIGRVLTLDHGKGNGRALMEQSMDVIRAQLSCRRMSLHAQKQAVGFYEKLGFSVVSDEFLEEGVVHVTMEKEFET